MCKTIPEGGKAGRLKILIVKIGAIGDVVMALPMLSAVRAHHPHAHVTWLSGKAVAPLLADINGIDEILVVNDAKLFSRSPMEQLGEAARVWWMLAPRSFDLIVIGHADRRYHLLARAARGTVRRRFQHGDRPNPISGRHHSYEYVRLITDEEGPNAPRFGLPGYRLSPEPEMARKLRDEGDSPLVVLAPGGARNAKEEQPLRRWPTEHYAKLARLLLDAGCRIAIVGAKSDAYTSTSFEGLDVLDFIGGTNLSQLMNIFLTADLVVSHDTSAIHLPRIVGTPVLALFGPTMPSEKLFMDGVSEFIWGGETLPCRPCYDGVGYADCPNNACMESISPSAAFARCSAMIERRRGMATRTPTG